MFFVRIAVYCSVQRYCKSVPHLINTGAQKKLDPFAFLTNKFKLHNFDGLYSVYFLY